MIVVSGSLGPLVAVVKSINGRNRRPEPLRSQVSALIIVTKGICPHPQCLLFIAGKDAFETAASATVCRAKRWVPIILEVGNVHGRQQAFSVGMKCMRASCFVVRLIVEGKV